MASTACMSGVLLQDPAVRAAAARVDWPELAALVRSAPRSVRTVLNPRYTNAAVMEILLSGDQAPPLLPWLEAQPNPADEQRPYCDALTAFREASEAAARVLLGGDLGWSRQEAKDALFANHSLLVRLGAGAQPGQVRLARCWVPRASSAIATRPRSRGPWALTRVSCAQAPHIDVVFSGAQFLTALSADCRPTCVYTGPMEPAAKRRSALDRAKEPLLLPRATLEAGMAPAHPERLQVGDVVGLSGPVVHGAPATDDGETRACLRHGFCGPPARADMRVTSALPPQAWSPSCPAPCPASRATTRTSSCCPGCTARSAATPMPSARL
jgi:hypothetical protein